MSNTKHITKSEFARLIGISRQGVNYAAHKSKAIRVEKDGKIDPDHPQNIVYQRNLRESAGVNLKAKAAGKPIKNKILIEQPDNNSARREPELAQSHETAPKYTQQDHANFTEKEKLKNEKEKILLQKEYIKIAKEEKEFIPFAWVSKLMNRVNGAIQSYFMPMDERLIPRIMAICKVRDKEIELELKKIISKEITTGLQQMTGNLKKLDFIKSSEFKGEI